MSNASYSRDVALLLSIMKNQKKIKDVVSRFNVSFEQKDKNFICNDEMVFDLCAMYMAQIGEEVKHLTTESKNNLNNTLDTSVLYQFRNMIDHTYEKVNKIMLSAYIEKAVRTETIKVVRDRVEYCKEHKKSTPAI